MELDTGGRSDSVGHAGRPVSHGYQVAVVYSCGVTFLRWVTPQEASVDLAVLAGRDNRAALLLKARDL